MHGRSASAATHKILPWVRPQQGMLGLLAQALQGTDRIVSLSMHKVVSIVVSLCRAAHHPCRLSAVAKHPLRRGNYRGRRLGVTYLWLVGNGGMVVIVVIIVPHSSIPY